MIIALDSLKFYKLKNENTARVLFVVLYAIFMIFYMFPFGETLDYQKLIDTIQSSRNVVPIVTTGNLIYMFSLVGLLFLTSFIGLIYSSCFVMESEGFPSKKAVISSFRKILVLIGFIFLMIPPFLISSFFLFVPMVFIYYSLFFTPLLIIEGKKTVIQAIIESFKVTKGFKFTIFVTQMMIYFLMNIPITLFTMGFLYSGTENTLAHYLILSFLNAARVLMFARMVGNFYLYIIKNEDKLQRVKIELFNYMKNHEIDETDVETDLSEESEESEETEETEETRDDEKTEEA